MELKMKTDLSTVDLPELAFNFDELKAELSARLNYYNNLVVTEDAQAEAKADRANLNKLAKALDDKRKEVKKQYMAPFETFEQNIKILTEMVKKSSDAINIQVKTFEETEKEKKREEIAAAYEELVPDTLLEIIPLKRILDQKWLNKGTTMKSIREDISVIANRTKIDIMYLESSIAPEHLTAVRAKYIETLNIDAAMDCRDALVAAEQAFKQREAQRAMYQPPVEKAAPVAVQDPVREPVPQTDNQEKLYSLRLAFQLTMSQANALKQFLADNNISYTKI